MLAIFWLMTGLLCVWCILATDSHILNQLRLGSVLVALMLICWYGLFIVYQVFINQLRLCDTLSCHGKSKVYLNQITMLPFIKKGEIVDSLKTFDEF